MAAPPAFFFWLFQLFGASGNIRPLAASCGVVRDCSRPLAWARGVGLAFLGEASASLEKLARA